MLLTQLPDNQLKYVTICWLKYASMVHIHTRLLSGQNLTWITKTELKRGESCFEISCTFPPHHVDLFLCAAASLLFTDFQSIDNTETVENLVQLSTSSPLTWLTFLSTVPAAIGPQSLLCYFVFTHMSCVLEKKKRKFLEKIAVSHPKKKRKLPSFSHRDDEEASLIPFNKMEIWIIAPTV